MKKKKEDFNKLVDKKMMKVLLWFNKLDYPARELILLKAYHDWNKKEERINEF